ncbi:L,D-transpeptidase [Roseibium sp. RKSG952]|uniref:L,D-transpeptidase n=1 Tax=Roseibium sp. RKSG952 TaxID=2529384 RepID=UPI0012BC9421|nr:L,D-transpeptidase [Roseibium sp. RKSG952]MTH98113.1 L,D-transpeptidase [Roseibium sp. RKSG952]
MGSTLSRRFVMLGLAATLASCQSRPQSVVQGGLAPFYDDKPDYATAYAPVRDGGFDLPRIDYQNVDPIYLRQSVWYSTPYEPGTIVVDPNNKFLYFIEPGGRAIRYGIGVGRAGFAWNGEAVIRFKREWPKWFPPDEMIAREPYLEKYRDGQEGGPGNPIGARGLYLWQDNKDTLYRIHGTNQPQSIGTNASSGCIRMWQQDIIDLYDRVPLGAKVVVLS